MSRSFVDVNRFADVDTEVSAYRSGVAYPDCDGLKFIFPGAHDSFRAAATRARKIVKALKDAGENGVSGHVGFSGEKPAYFPRNGVHL